MRGSLEKWYLEKWYLYRPHWSLPPDLQNGSAEPSFISAAQRTYVKKSTAFSWELPGESVRFVPEGAGFRPCSLFPVQDPVEARRHQYSADHFEAVLDFEARTTLEKLNSRWFIFTPHWADSDGIPGKVATEETWLKRCWRPAQDLNPNEKVAINRGEVVAFSGVFRKPAQQGVSQADLAAQHWEVEVSSRDMIRLQKNAPRRPLCKYFSSNRVILQRDILECFQNTEFGPGWDPQASRETKPVAASPLALLLPHGGYCNSGYVAAHGFKLLANRPINNVVIVGNNHAAWNKIALCDQVWSTPLGKLSPSSGILRELTEIGYSTDRLVHADEHSIENQLPFLQFLHPEAKIVPVGVGNVSLKEAQALALLLARVVRTSGATLIGTTDFSHEGPSYGGPAMYMHDVTELTRSKDSPLLDVVLAMDPEELLRLSNGSSMCGAGAATVFILCCKELGFTRPELLKYLINTEVTPCSSTTGFASFAFRPE